MSNIAKNTGKKIPSRMTFIVSTLMTLIFLFLIAYVALPAFSLVSAGFWSYIVLVLITLSNFALIIDKIKRTSSLKYISIITGSILIIFGLLGLFSSPLFNTETYKNAMALEVGNFEEDFPDIRSEMNYDMLDLDTAIRLGDRVVGSIPNASWYNVDDEYNLILYQGEQYRLSPLNYGGFFKYMSANDSGIPGYVLVNVRTGDAKFVNSAQPIHYSPSGYFSKNLNRHLRVQFPSYVFDTSFLEIDETGKPYWITGVKRSTAGLFGAKVVSSFILTDASTGESKEYLVSERPEWIDHVFSLDYLTELAYWHFEYENGVINFSKTGVQRTSYYYRYNEDDEFETNANFYGYNSLVNKDGEVCFYTGLTAANMTESNTGFITMNTATGVVKYYDIPGAEESSAQSVAEGIVQNLGYVATYPIIVNIAGNPTYLMNLKDKAGIIQRTALVNVQNYSVATVGQNFATTLSDYLIKLGMEESNNTKVSPTGELLQITGEIAEIHQVEMDGTTYFFYVIEDKLFKASIKIDEMQVLLKTGDKVTVSYYEEAINIVQAISK